MLNVNQAKLYLRIGRTTLDSLVRAGALEKPTKKGGRCFWTKDQLDDCKPELERRIKARNSSKPKSKHDRKIYFAASEYAPPKGWHIAFNNMKTN